MSKEIVKCPICGGATIYEERKKKQKYICLNDECSTQLVKDRDFIFMDATRKKESEIWNKYRYKRLTLEEINSLAEGGRIPDREHKESGFDKDIQEALRKTEKTTVGYNSKEERFVSGGILCPFSWIEVTQPAGCLSSMFGGRDKLVWQAQPCMASKCKLWDSSEENCGLITKKS